MILFLYVVHVIVCFFLILVVLLQQGKGQDIGSAFGGGGTQAAFGSRTGATLLTKLTAIAAAAFMLTSITLTILVSRPAVDSVLDEDAISIPAEPPDGGALPDDAVPGTLDGEGILPEETEGGIAPAQEAEPEN